MDERAIRQQLREVKRELRAKRIRRVSCFNGGHTPESYRLNAELFRLETLLKDALKRK